jgi:hypothetical protein
VSSSKQPQNPRIYNRRHLYSALKLTATLVDKRNGTTRPPSTATGFALHVQGDPRRTLIVTNRHVLDPAYSGRPEHASCYIERLQISGRSVSRGQNDLFEFTIDHPIPLLSKNYDHDVAAIDITDLDVPLAVHGTAFDSGDLIPEFDAITDEVGPGTPIVMAGYPRLENGVGDRPILVPGQVASDLNYAAEYGGNVYPQRGLCHSFSRGGMSGSPVLAAVMWDKSWDGTDVERRVRLLGINVGHPTERNGVETLSLFVPAWALASILVDAGDQLAELMVILAESRRRMEFGDLFTDSRHSDLPDEEHDTEPW